MNLAAPDCFRLRNVSKTYPQGDKPPLKALRGLTVNVPWNARVAVLGVSGSGKSTLLHLLGLLDCADDGSSDLVYHPPGGPLNYLGSNDGSSDVRPLKESQQPELRRGDFGFVFQSHHLLPGLSCGENVALGLALAGAGTNDRLQTAAKLLAELGLTDYAQRRPRELSGGEAQRVAVLRAMAHGPRVVFADEPTGSLDRENTRRVMELLTTWQQDNDAGPRTLLLATHDVDEAFHHCDHFLVLKHGRLHRKGLLTRNDAPTIETLQQLLHSEEEKPAEIDAPDAQREAGATPKRDGPFM